MNFQGMGCRRFCRRVSLPIGAPLGKMERFAFRDFLREEDSISGFLSCTQRIIKVKSGGHLELW
jgi:hypothetical protein